MSKKVPPPAGLSPRAEAVWRDFVAERERDGISAGRLRLLERFCRSSDLHDLAEQQLAGASLVVVTKTTGAEHVNPLLKARLEVGAELDRLARLLGLDQDVAL